MNVKGIDCTSGDQHDLPARYLVGSLTGSEAEAFEVHSLSCPRCWSELQQGAQLRAAFGKPFVETVVTATANRRASRDLATPFAAAAVVAILAIGLAYLNQTAALPNTPASRGVSAALDLTVKLDAAGRTVLEWEPDPAAANYRLTILRSDGVAVLKSQTADRRLILDVGAFPPRPAGVSLVARVEALDPVGRVAARSGFVTLPIR